jgi:hypothetical protein
LLRAKYFPNGELVDTVFPTNASPTWWSIEYGPELLKKGIVWRVGSGAKIQIWRDSWLPRVVQKKLLEMWLSKTSVGITTNGARTKRMGCPVA